jgi:predicted enzyme related to lactoylglutathione lyase
MKINHIHVGVRDLQSAVEWLHKVWDLQPAFHKPSHMATFQFESFILIFDAAEKDCPVTIGIETDNCDFEYEYALQKGATSVKKPENMPWGARAGYIQGPGSVIFEFESAVTTA